ncbi:NupC/NupG family nucleoside CNT transporter [Pararhodospirillum oryzae]|uniref:Nucleoside:proton symporter n=1 Tax=Pararhodospirillum oryzae TaxID=478448 RepID=A0A512HBK3_9PROT|nr:nucleoside transporter C-terminal domain-containing protein [Pararhodospirillum oryzae]GEO82837.1 nucleoside:proton symporter [Pararhodospirillum oryzae]
MVALQSLLGLGVFVALGWALSEKRRAVAWRTVGIGVALQIVIALALLKIPFLQPVFIALNDLVGALQTATRAGSSFVFGYLGGGELPYAPGGAGSSFVLAFQALPLILVMSALSSLLFHWRILPVIVRGFARALERTLGVGGAVGVAAAANIFVGMVEAPLFIRPYVRQLTRAELFMVMTCGMATIAGTVMALYASFLQGVIDNPLGQLLVASLISAPAAIVVAVLLVPGEAGTRGEYQPTPSEATTAIEAIAIGAQEGVALLWNIVALLLVMVALVALVNGALGLLPDLDGAPLTLERLLGWLMAPVCWLMGLPWAEATVAAPLLGIKVILNELIAYLGLSHLPADALSERSRLIMTYALCGFANFGSLGIMVGGLTALAPERRAEIAGLGLKSILSGTLATCMTGAVVGLVVG